MSLLTKNSSKSNSNVVTIRVDPKVRSQLINLAKESRREFSDYMRLILEDVVKNKTRV